jgi:Calpain family cysteine protease/GRF zinc finger
MHKCTNSSRKFPRFMWLCSKHCDSIAAPPPEVISDADPRFPPCKESIYPHCSDPLPKHRTPTCMCGKDCTVKSSDSATNFGRSFFACAASKCKFFRWLDTLTPYAAVIKKSTWKKCSEPEYKLYRSSANMFNASDIIQGKLGDCWFLSALAVVAENSSLISRLFLHLSTSDSISVCLFIDGELKTVTVDRQFPVILQPNGSECFVFSKAADNQLWVSAAEKAYAKAYGAYSRISGGEVAEALFDLTGCPVESVDVAACKQDPQVADDLWTKLLSFHSTGFVMGCGTSRGSSEDGIAGFHAYSILDVIELNNVLVGKQKKIDDYFRRKDTREDSNVEQVVRLLKIRNPWGKYEWKGKWSSSSDLWTTSLKTNLGNTIKNDGCFFMEFSDFLDNFSVIDVCKTHKDWYELSMHVSLGSKYLRLRTIEFTWLYIMVIQPSKRKLSKRPINYAAMGILVRSSASGEIVASLVPGCRRLSILECFLPAGEYTVDLPTLASESSKDVLVRVYSANAVLAETSDAQVTVPFPLCAIVTQTQLNQLIRITKDLRLEVREASGVVYFIFVEDAKSSDACSLRVNVILTDLLGNQLLSIGSWVYQSKRAKHSELVGILRASRPKYDGEPVTGYSFDMEISSADENCKRQRVM